MVDTPAIHILRWPEVVLKHVPLAVEILSQSRKLREDFISLRSQFHAKVIL